MVEEKPTRKTGGLHAYQNVVTPAPPNSWVLFNERPGQHGRDARAGYAEQVAECVACEAVLHGDEFAHDVEVGELGGCCDAHYRCADY